MKQKNYIAGLYFRLSQEDERQGESVSIENQRTMLRKYAEEHGFEIHGEYIDDGISGTTFDRPEVQRLLDDAKTGVINTIIVYNVFLPEVKYVLDQGGKVVLMASNPIDIHNESDFEKKEYNNPKFLQMSSDILQRNVGFIPIENIRQIVNSEYQVVWTNNTYFYELD